ncbi:MAG TPA: DUF262 domain-containing protein [Chitinophagaceae bacterium]|nr:DUF262 domain-containing protein [Chitinophagaceae bacterium]
MQYEIKEWCIQDLIELYDKKKLNLNPPYQRNDIWPPLSKKRLIESVKLGYPLPTFFIHQKNGNYDMVDGQQRTRTFIGYQKKLFSDTEKKDYDATTDDKLYREYRIFVCIITTEEGGEGMVEDFYYRVNKYGIKLNRPEIKRAEFFSTAFQELVEKLAGSEEFEKLKLFTAKSLDRLSDLDFVSELITLEKFGITDKKITVDKLYENQSIGPEEIQSLETGFTNILRKIIELDKLYSISATRYRQRNDFYTLFSFIHNHGSKISDELLRYQYKILVLIGEDIYPTNDKCWSFQEYANNCVSQSNSKRAREERLKFFERLLLNKEPNPLSKIKENEETEYDVISDAIKFYNISEKPLKEIDGYCLLDSGILNELKKEIIFTEDAV